MTQETLTARRALCAQLDAMRRPTAGLWDTGGERSEYEAKQAERTLWFRKISDATNWKNAIDCWIAAEDFADCAQASIWFTGSVLEPVEQSGGRVRVRAEGYYAAIGA